MKLIQRTTVLVLQALISVDQASCSAMDENQETEATSAPVSLPDSSEAPREKSIWGIGEEQLDNLFDNSACLVCLGDARFLYRVNKNWKKTLEWDEDFLKRPFVEIIHPDDIPPSQTIAQEGEVNSLVHQNETSSDQTKKIQLVTNFSNRQRTKHGDYRHLEWLILLQVSGSTTSPPILGLAQDVTLKKQAEIQKQALEEAQLATRMKSTFVAHMSHELRTPLNGIIGFLDLALEEDLSNNLRNYLTHARESAGLLLEIADNIVDVSRLDAGRLTLQKRVFNPIESLHAVIHSLKDQATQKNIQLKCSTSASMPTVLQGDEHRFQQILSNLGRNAVKYTQQGQVSIKLESYPYPVPDQPHQIMIRGRVKDTGIGIQPQFISKLFQPFTQEDQSMKRDFGGTGLGLYLTKELCEKMGGSIHVLSTPGLGSTFEFKVIMTPVESSQTKSH